ncbi:gluconokinase [Phenylobacterium sp.]|uniref:gluconokinase n=1 Tax=Phenylobacterium sp. TaxID=1871053 RepID=UPI00263207D5|nr:gluconokinase [Phenylobacterium sp.]
MTTAPIILVMGVSGAGKTTIASRLAERLGWAFLDADDLHPPANHAKMARGEPLDDADRRPWLAAVSDWMQTQQKRGAPAVVACSALKRAYRDRLRRGVADLAIVFIQAAPQLLAERLARRSGHFMPPSLLTSQIETLEPPTADETVIVVQAAQTPEQIVERVLDWVGDRPSTRS